MEYRKIRKEDEHIFHTLLEAYYREGEDADTPQEALDSFIGFLFSQVMDEAIRGCFVLEDGTPVGFALWAVDSDALPFSQLPGLGTILEIGLIPGYRASGRGRALAAYAESRLAEQGIRQCYVCAYQPAQPFWNRCGYTDSGTVADNGLPILIKSILA